MAVVTTHLTSLPLICARVLVAVGALSHCPSAQRWQCPCPWLNLGKLRLWTSFLRGGYPLYDIRLVMPLSVITDRERKE